MRSSHVATALAAFTAGLTASAALRRLARRRRAATPALTSSAPATTVTAPAVVPLVEGHDAVVLPFARLTLPAPARKQPAAPARCGDSGGRTKAGSPCAARPSSGGRCHHHPLAA